MARSYAAIHLRIWTDPEWRALDGDAQHLYLLLLSQPSLNLAGVLPLQSRRWAACVADWDAPTVDMALTRLADARFVVIDEDTEEVLIRSFIRNDGSYKIPNVLKSLLQVAEVTQGSTLRAELAAELGRLDPLGGKKADEGRQLVAATRLILGATDGPSGPGGEPLPEPLAEGLPDGFVVTHSPTVTETVNQPLPEPMPQPSGSGSGSGALLSLADYKGGESTSPPPAEAPPCRTHADWEPDDIPPCRACGRARERWKAEHAEWDRLASAEAAKPKPMCGIHPGEVAHNCRCCAADRKAAS